MIRAIRMCTVGLAIVMVMIGLGCGGLTRTEVDSTRTRMPRADATGPHIQMVGVTHELELENPAFMDAVERYMVDQAVAVLERDRNYRMLLDPEVALRWSDLEIPASETSLAQAEPEGFVTVHISELEERLGGTVRIGIVSRQRRFAEAKVRVRLERPGQPVLESQGRGRSEVGAWGVIVAVDRDQMRTGEGVWAIDESMVGLACRAALVDAVRGLPRTW